jgi:hypothetical protein
MGILCRGLLLLVSISFTIPFSAGLADEPQKATAAEGVRVRINDVVINRGRRGLWTLKKRKLKRVSPLRPRAIAVGDLNKDGRHDIIFSVTTPAARRGTWAAIGTAAPNRIDPRPGARIATGDFDGDGRADIITAFQGTSGAHLRMNNGAFFEVHASTPISVAAGDLDGDGKDDVIISLPNGVFTCYQAMAPWIRLTPHSGQNVMVADLDNNGKDDLIVDRGTQGLWKRMNDAGPLTRINAQNPSLLDAADPDGNHRDGVLASFPNGLFFSPTGNGSFTRISPNRPLDMIVGDFNNDGKDDIVTLFRGKLQIRQNNVGPWKTFPGVPAAGIIDIVAAGLDGQCGLDVVECILNSSYRRW